MPTNSDAPQDKAHRHSSQSVKGLPSVKDSQPAKGSLPVKGAQHSLNVMAFNMAQPSLIEASAGTGKTYTITNLVLRALLCVGKAGTVLERPLQLDEMLIVTFTNAATADLRRRVYDRIREARVYFESFLDFSLDYMLQLLHTQGVADDAAAADWEHKGARAKVEALIVRKKQQFAVENAAAAKELGEESESVSASASADGAGAGAADGKSGAGAAGDQAVAYDDLYLFSHLSDEELDQLFVEFSFEELLAVAKSKYGLNSDLILEEILLELLTRSSILARSELSSGPKISLSASGGASGASDASGADGAGEESEVAGADAEAEVAASQQSQQPRSLAASFLRKAIQVLLNAERTINTASICTIHSFCNQALTQNYSLESGEPFNTELKLDAQQEIHEACYAVWRRLFYQYHSSDNLLKNLLVPSKNSWNGDPGVDGPISFYEKVRELNKVRLSDSADGFYGYQLSGIQDLLKACDCHIEQSQELEPQLLEYIAWFDHLIAKMYSEILSEGSVFAKAHPQEEYAQLYNAEQGEFGPKVLEICAKAKPLADVKDYLASVTNFYTCLEQVQNKQQSLQQLKRQAVALGLVANEQVDFSLLKGNVIATSKDAQALIGTIEQQQIVVQHTLEQLFAAVQSFWQEPETALCQRSNAEKVAAVEPLVAFIVNLKATLAPVVDKPMAILKKIGFLLRTLVAIVVNEEYALTCKDQYVVDTDEVLRRLDYALNSRGELSDRLAWSLQARYPLAMIDEFQDTDPVQFNIFSKIYLNAEAMKRHACCYLIGDPKQSIYAFRGADINSYIKAKQKVEQLTHGDGIYTLDTNYRSSPDIVYATNALFEPWFNPKNVNPFNDVYISFSPVYSKLQKQQMMHKDKAASTATTAATASKDTKGKAKAQAKAKGAKGAAMAAQAEAAPKAAAKSGGGDFIWEGANELLLESPKDQAASETEQVQEKPRAVPSFKPHEPQESQAKAVASVAAEPMATTVEGAGISDNAGRALFLGAGEQGHTYIVDVGEQSNKNSLHDCYATAMAQLVKSLLDCGQLRDHGKMRKVTSGDIAILVRSSGESDVVQAKLWDLQIPSVYYSDASSVLSDGAGGPSAESLELIYLMEAMCDCTSRLKISRVLGSRLLNLNTAEFQELIAEQSFEQEVQIISKCARTWAKYGFLPAFLQWDELHHMGERLLKLKDGERLYTNYCHISEIVQTVHQQKTSITAQLHWFHELVYQNQAIFEQDTTTKRLASEQEQIKIMTMHKSKGLEFPIVLMPFLWSSNQERSVVNNYFKVCKYYDYDAEHIVLDYAPERSLKRTVLEPKIDEGDEHQAHVKGQHPIVVNKDLANFMAQQLASSSSNSDVEAEAVQEASWANFAGQACYLKEEEQEISAEAQSKQDELCEQMRLLYVTITRAKYANFLFVGMIKGGRVSDKETALPHIHGIPNDSGKNTTNQSFFLRAAQCLPWLFTILNGQKLLDQAEEAKEAQAAKDAKAATVTATAAATASNSGDPNVPKVHEAHKAVSIPPYASSFLYKDAINRNFNIFSYTSLVVGAGNAVNIPRWEGSADDKMHETEIEMGVHEGADDEFLLEGTASTKLTPAQAKAKTKTASTKAPLVRDEDCSLSAIMDGVWPQAFFDNKVKQLCNGSIAKDFPRGTTPGSFIHEVLQTVEFEQLKTLGWYEYLIAQLMEVVASTNAGYKRMLTMFSNQVNEPISDQGSVFKHRLGEWLNDVLEAPMVQGRYHYFALADLHPLSYEREMEFLMSCNGVNTADIDELCKEVAKSLLLSQEQQEFVQSLHLTQSELVGFCKGSIDLACRFNLDERLILRLRPDLKDAMPQKLVTKVTNNVAALQQQLASPKAASKLPSFIKQDGEINLALSAQATEDVKYYVVDYKTNNLGDTPDKYDQNMLLSSIYTHRYDVQFLIYTLALYRFLKRRMGVPFDATEQELREFYDQHIGGVIYLYLRGMRANYLRDRLSTGVFSTKIDFAVIYKLDHIFAGDAS